MTSAGSAMIAANLLRTKLSDEEFDELGDFLQARCVPMGGMPLSMLDGFLTAVVSCPEFIVPSEWLPLIWSSGDDARPSDAHATEERHGDDDAVFESSEQAQRLTSLVLRRMDEIMRDLDEGIVEPIFLKISDDTGAQAVFADVWCAGYLRGMALREEAWDPLASPNNAASDYLAPILALALPLIAPDDDEDDDGEEVAGVATDYHADNDDDLSNDALEVLDTQLGDDVSELVADSALAIHRYWRDQRRPPQLTIRRGPQPGRNAACPCGSGRKYKKCCAP